MRHTSIKQSGFTLVEIAIVLVIIGLLLGGVLKGQEMIENARIKGAAADMNGIVAAYNSYLDRFHAIPGDDGPAGTITGRGSAWAGVTAGGTNGVLNIAQGQVFTAPAGSEGTAFWQQLRAAGFISGEKNFFDELYVYAWFVGLGLAAGLYFALERGRAARR